MRIRLLSCLVGLLLSASVYGQNVDLVTLPKRNTVQLTIYNSEDITLVKEWREITLRKGLNRIQFSWDGTLIDPTSVEMRPLEQTNAIEVADTVYPGHKPQHLIWNIESEFEGQALIEVSYFTSGLTWTMDYVAVSNPEETELNFTGHVRVFNNSGEEYENAKVRLIVGKINLVEKIAELARGRGERAPSRDSARFRYWKKYAASNVIETAQEALSEGREADGVGQKPKGVVKDSVGEYFMFSVEGTETIPNGWSKRMPAVNAESVAFDILYRLRTFQYGPRPVRFFIWKNDEEHGLGSSPLPNGVVRLFRDNGRDGLSFLGQQTIRYAPIQADIEINLGADDNVVYEQRKLETKRNNFQFRNNSVVGWDEHQHWQGIVRNYHTKPIQFELRMQLDGDVEFTVTTPASSFDYRTVEFMLETAKRNRTRFPFRTTIHHGNNAKQNRVKLRSPS